MPARLVLADAESAADVRTFAARAALLTEDAVRLQAASGVLAITAAPLAPRGLGDPTPTVLALRTVAADPELVCDLVVVASALQPDTSDDRALLLPETGLAPAWAGVSPPRGGWVEVRTVDAAALAARAHAGIARVAEAVPTDAGEDVVRAVRAAVWGVPDDSVADLPLGAAFGAVALGFVGGAETVRVLASGPWRRLAFRRGHVIVRGPAVTGLQPVRSTGAA